MMEPDPNVAVRFREALGTVELLVKTADKRHFTEYDVMRLEQCAFMIRTMLGLPEKPPVADLRRAATRPGAPPPPPTERTIGEVVSRWWSGRSRRRGR
jgi:hypothetical protein